MIQFNNSCIQAFQASCANVMISYGTTIYLCGGTIPVVDAASTNLTLGTVLATAQVTLATSGSLIKLNTAALNVNVTATGTVTHFVIKNGLADVTYCVVGTVSTQVIGTAPLLLSTINVTVGGKVDLLDLGINLLSY